MRIDTNLGGFEALNAEALARSATRAKSATTSDSEDRADLSFDGPSLSELQARALSTPEIRADRVASLRQQIESGDYRVNAAAVAGAMLNNWWSL